MTVYTLDRYGSYHTASTFVRGAQLQRRTEGGPATIS
jgi:hypothetical protein